MEKRRGRSMVTEHFNWTTVSLKEVLEAGNRLEASVFNIEAKRARELVISSEYGYEILDDLIEESYYPGRFKRLYAPENEGGVEFYLPSQMTDIYPVPDKWIYALTKANFEDLRLKEETLLMTRSGTIGNVQLVSNNLKGKVFSDDVIRTKFKIKENLGYVYTFFKTEYGNKILQTSKYGSVITHIEPEHLKEIVVPKTTIEIKKIIDDKIRNSFALRDKSNDLIDEATKLLIDELELSPLEEMKKQSESYHNEVTTFSTKLSELNARLEAKYHLPLKDLIVEHLKNTSNVVLLGNEELTEKIILAGVFKRNYVAKDYGYPFIGGKGITQLAPSTDKYLSKVTHRARYKKELKIEENWILVTDRGTIGTTVLVPKHFEKYAVSQNVLKVVPKKLNGYLFAFLNSEYGQVLIKSQTYGSVVNMIDHKSLACVEVPLLKDEKKMEQINDLVLKANDLRYQAYLDEQEAIRIMNEDVLGITE